MTFDNIKLDKGLYTSNKGFTRALEEIDPSENYIGTELEGLDAYERQLKRFDIKVKGANSDTISKFFQTSDSAALFPEYVSRAVRTGLTNNILDDLVATTTIIDSLDYRSIECLESEKVTDGRDFINEGTHIPETVIKTNSNLTQLHKVGRSLVASYEALKSQRLDLFTVSLGQIGNYIANCEVMQAINTLLGATKSLDYAGDEIAYTDLIEMWKSLAPYEMNTIIAEGDNLTRILQMNEFKDSNAGQNFHATGQLATPVGAKLVYSPTNVLGDKVIAIDKRYALEKVQFGDIVTDFDKLIDRQLERATITLTSGFNRLIDGACVIAS